MESQIIGIDAKRYPEFSHVDEGKILLTVLVKRIEGTHKAYAGIVPDVSRTDPQYLSVREWVKSNGNPLRYDEAKAIWDMKPQEYAR